MDREQDLSPDSWDETGWDYGYAAVDYDHDDLDDDWTADGAEFDHDAVYYKKRMRPRRNQSSMRRPTTRPTRPTLMRASISLICAWPEDFSQLWLSRIQVPATSLLELQHPVAHLRPRPHLEKARKARKEKGKVEVAGVPRIIMRSHP